MVVGGTGSLDLLVQGPFVLLAFGDFLGGCYSQGCHGYRHAFLQFLRLLSHLPHTHLLAMGLNVAKCNLGEVKQEMMLASGLRC